MGIVGRKGKLTITDDPADDRPAGWERYEDVLTADVFGAYRYLPPSLGILPVLRQCIDENGCAFPAYLASFGISLSDLSVARLRFWPRFSDGSQPDVFILLESADRKLSLGLLIEAKYHAEQHDIGGVSQLGHYLIQHLADRYEASSLSWQLPERPRPLLFITRHEEPPVSQLTRARRESFAAHTSIPFADQRLFWTNWATVGEEAKSQWRIHRGDVEHAPWLRLLLDLYEEIRSRDLLRRKPFEGIVAPEFRQLEHHYQRNYDWSNPLWPVNHIVHHGNPSSEEADRTLAQHCYSRTYIAETPGWNLTRDS